MSTLDTMDLDAMLKRLHLPTVRRLYAELEERAEADEMSHRDYLALLMAEEIAHRAQTRIQRSVRKAKFPFLAPIEDFDFTFQTSVRLQTTGSDSPACRQHCRTPAQGTLDGPTRALPSLCRANPPRSTLQLELIGAPALGAGGRQEPGWNSYPFCTGPGSHFLRPVSRRGAFACPLPAPPAAAVRVQKKV